MKQIRDCPSCIIFYASRASRVQGTSAVNVCTYGWSNRLTNFENETETCFFVFCHLTMVLLEDAWWIDNLTRQGDRKSVV